MHDFRRLKAWQKANALELRMEAFVTRIGRTHPALADQIERATASIAANIAEGCGRETKADFRRFITISIGSTTELENHLIRAHQRGLITDVELDSLIADSTEVRKILHGLRKSLAA
jgi:four helix bundle protein